MKKIFAILKRQIEISIKGFRAMTYAVVIVSLFGFGIGAVYETLGSLNQDVTSTSLYYPFAIFAACGAICFSWVRAIEPSQTVKIDRVRLCAENFFLSAILFLIASLFKLFAIHPLSENNVIIKTFKNSSVFINWAFPFIFVVAYFIGVVSIMRILVLLIFKRISLFDKSNPKEQQEIKTLKEIQSAQYK